MSENKTVEVMEAIYDKNEEVAKLTNADFTNKGILAINVMGAPGVGKTSVLCQIIKRLGPVKPYVIEGDIEADYDTKLLQALGVEAVQINTGGACHLDSPLIAEAAQEFTLQEGILFIENIGNLVCPAEFMIGEHAKLLITNVTEGSDKPYKYPLAFEKADLIVINKVDLLSYVDFDEEFFMAGVRALNKMAPVVKVSCKNEEGFEEIIKWLENKHASVKK